MNDNRHQRFFQEINPPSGLFAEILARVAVAEQHAARLRLAVFGALTLSSVLVLIPAIQYAVSEFYTSGFYEYATLSFDSVLGGYWKELLYSLADSFPSLSLLFLGVIVTVGMWSLRRMNRDARVAFTSVALSV